MDHVEERQTLSAIVLLDVLTDVKRSGRLRLG